MRQIRYFAVILYALFSSFNALAVTKQLEDALGDIDTQLNTEPSKFFYQLNQLKPELLTFDDYSQQYFWVLYCQTAVRMELYQEVIEIANTRLNQAPNGTPDDIRIELVLCRAEAKQSIGKLQQSLLDYHMALEQATSAKLTELMVDALVRAGEVHAMQSNFVEGQKHLQDAYRLAKSLAKPEILNIVNGALGGFYAYKKDYAKAIPFYKKTKEFHLEKGHIQQASISVYNLGAIASKLERYSEALEYLAEAKQLSEQVADIPGIAYAELKMVPALLAAGRFEEVRSSLEVAYNFFFNQSNATAIGEIALYQAKLDSHDGNYEQANERLKGALQVFLDSDLPSQQSLAYKQLSENYQRLEQLDSSLLYFKKFHEVEVELSERQREETSERLLAEFQFELKENENSQLKQLLEIEQEKVKAQAQTQRLQIGLIVAAILLITFAAFYVYKQYSYGKKMRALAMRDDLTQIANRRAIMASLKKSVSWSLRYQDPLSIAIFDIDNFKRFNDSHGHEIGDKVLIAFAQEVSAAIRATDDFGRLGGEEFMLIMPNTNAEQAKVLLSRIMPTIRAFTVKAKGKNLHITASAGVTEFDIKNETLMDLYGRADAALYLAKESGRDQYKIS